MSGFRCLATMDRAPRLRPLHYAGRPRASNGTGTMTERADWKFLLGQTRKYSWRSVFIREGNQMNNERKSSKAGERAAEGLREATAKDEAKNESKTGHDLAKGADRFEERSKSSDGQSAQEKQKG